MSANSLRVVCYEIPIPDYYCEAVFYKQLFFQDQKSLEEIVSHCENLIQVAKEVSLGQETDSDAERVIETLNAIAADPYLQLPRLHGCMYMTNTFVAVPKLGITAQERKAHLTVRYVDVY